MLLSIDLVLLVVAFVCFVIAFSGVPTGKLNVVALGLALWVLSLIV